ncbi:MAG TPA: Rv1355c family protein, partial [Mycobacterium sp.]|nr:Rv1355c family protein [Mycobacterium sp.]
MQILDLNSTADCGAVDELRGTPGIAVVDRLDEQRAGLARLIPAPDRDLLDEPSRWVYYPWRRTIVHVLGPLAFRRLRLDRNRNMITADEQDRLGRQRIGVVGLSVGHVVAHTLAAEGLAGSLVLADFDELELSNLNRVPATVFDLGENKAVVAARRIAELDPYLDVQVLTAGLTTDTMAEFLSGLDVVVEECDALDMKALVRLSARAARIPVVMATSDRGMVDVERFDLEPDRPILHGLIGDTGIDELADLSSRDKVPHVLRVVDAANGSARGAASMLEVGRTISTWPQLA